MVRARRPTNRTSPDTALLRLAAGLVTLSVLALETSHGDETELRAVSAFPDGTAFSVDFERFVERVNQGSQGLVHIDYRGGGAKVMNPFQIGDALRTGVVDIANLPGAYYTRLMPEADAIKLSAFTIAQERETGAWAYMNELHARKVNAWHLARQKDCVPFHLYLNRRIDTPDLTGLRIRVSPVYRAFFGSLGATMVRTNPGDVHTALERGVVDGYGWPLQSVVELGFAEVTRYRVDPGFYRASVEVLVNLDTWTRLDADRRLALEKAAAWLEGLCAEDEALNETERTRQTDSGIEPIRFNGEAGRRYLRQAHRAGWDAFIRKSPEHGPKLEALLSR